MRPKYLIAFLPLGVLFANFTALFPHRVEKFYASRYYPLLSQNLSTATGYFSFSIGEVTVVGGFLLFIISLVKLLLALAKSKQGRLEKIKSYSLNILTVIGVIYFGFVITWGLNYNRLPFSQIAQYEMEPISVEELALVCEDLILRANALRQ